LKFRNEDYFLSLVIDLIKSDEQNQQLLSNVHFSCVSSVQMKQLLDNDLIDIDCLDFDLFQEIKNRLSCEILFPATQIPFSRWDENPKMFDYHEVKNFFEVFDSFFPDRIKHVDKLKEHISIYSVHQEKF
jgi:hypothetical protein